MDNVNTDAQSIINVMDSLKKTAQSLKSFTIANKDEICSRIVCTMKGRQGDSIAVKFSDFMDRNEKISDDLYLEAEKLKIYLLKLDMNIAEETS